MPFLNVKRTAVTVFGMKESATTGSISASSNSLTVASAAGFAIGDPIIVETGGEAGLGMFGTIGVGGAWPNRVFATDAEVLAQTVSYGATSGNPGYFARAADSGKAYQGNNTNTGYYPWDANLYYSNKAQPHALVTTITNIAGNVLTLAAPAVVATTNANVYFDCRPILDALDESQENILPTGTFRYSGAIQYASDKRPGFVLKGQPAYATKLIVPKGCTCVGFQFFQCNNFHLENLDIVLNFGDSGSGYCLYTTNGDDNHNYGWGVQVVATSTSAVDVQNIVRNVRVTNVMKEAIHGAASGRLLFDNCHVIRTVKQQHYAGWQIQASDTGMGEGEIYPSIEFRDCSFTSPWMAWGAETFGSSGVRFLRLNMHNGLMAFNSASQTELINPVFYVTENAIATDVYAVMSIYSPLLDLNSNISGQSGIAAAGTGALIENPTFTFEGTVQPDTYMTAISLTASGDVWIKGTYDPTTADDGDREGLIAGPWAPAGSASPAKGPIINVGGPRVKVTGIRITTDVNQAVDDFSVAVGIGYTTTSSTINALGTSGTGSITVASTQWFGGGGKLLIDTERMAYTAIDDTHLNITARGIDSTTAATHANGATMTYLDTPIVQDNVVDNIYMPTPLAVNTGNVTNEEYEALGTPSMPAGADALWYADQANTTAVRQHVPNEITKATVAVPTWINASPKPRVDLSLTTVTQTTGVADSYGGHNGLRLVGTGSSWLARDDFFINFKAMSYTLVVIGKSNSGGSQTAKLNFGFSGGAGTTVTFNTTLTRVSHTATKGAGNDNPLNLSSSGAGADITIERWFVYEGADPFPGNVNGEEYGGHLLFGGGSAYVNRPTVASNEVDINSATALGQILFDSFRSLTSFTAFAMVRKVAATPGSDHNLIHVASTSTGVSYDGMALSADYANGIGFNYKGFGALCYRQPFIPGVNTTFELLNKDYNVLVWQYNAATSTASFWLNDVLIGGEVAARTALADFYGLTFNYPGPRATVKWNSGAFYPSALSRANIEAVVSTLRAKATANGLTLDTMDNYVAWEGDSNTDGSGAAIGIGGPGGGSWPYLFVPNATEEFYGIPFAQNGAQLSWMVARAPFVNAAIPTTKAGRKFILAGMVGTNDASTVYTSDAATYSANLLAYWAAAKAAGWTTIGMPILPRTDVNVAASPPFDTWRGTINTNLVAAVGTQLDACLNPASVPLLFANGASDNTTYFHPDKVHLKPAGQVLLEAAMRPIINGFL